MSILSRIHAESLLLISGDFNARTGSITPVLTSCVHPFRAACDQVICPRGEWLIGVSELF
jgi:hypothetical protein